MIGKKTLTAMVLAGLMAVQFTAVISAKDVVAAAQPAAVTAQNVKAEPQEVKKAPKLALKIDRVDKDQLPRNFRTTNDQFKGLTKDGILPTREGMSTTRASASSIFSEKEFKQVLKNVPVKPEKFYDIDLRAESHGYINGTAVSWFADHDWGNDGRTPYIVKHVETDQLNSAKKKGVVKIYQFNDKGNKLMTPIEMQVNSVRNEEQMVKEHGANYYRIVIDDHFRPSDKNMDDFIAFYKTLPKDAWLHFHCYAGMGRTTIMMVAYDIMKNASKVSFDDIIKRQALIGIVDLSEIKDSKKNWGRKLYIDRYQFTKQFYDYCKAHPNFDITYSEWTKQHGYESYEPNYEGYIWRIDTTDKNQLPRNFRTSLSKFGEVSEKYIGQLDPAYVPTRKGMDTLNISGSGQCSAGEFKAVVAELKKYAKGPIYDFDLRQESHGYFNGNAVSWYGLRDWGNLGKSHDAIIKDETNRIKSALGQKVIVSELNKKKFAMNPKQIKVTSAMTEEEMAKSLGVNYVRITATDHVWPAPDKVDQFVNFFRTMPKNAWLHFHCQAGVGRTTAYMAMADMMKNPDVSLKDILQRQHLIGGNYVAYKIPKPKKDQWKADYYADKARMVKLFYTYVQQNYQNNFATPWSQWLAANDVVGK